MADHPSGNDTRAAGAVPTFAAFISYAREDEAFARMLEAGIEAFRPEGAAAGARIFRDRSDFTGSEYAHALDGHLRESASLIVVCTPAARASSYVADEIRRFAAIRGGDRIFSVLLDGLPNEEADERKAFPQALIEVTGGNPLGAEYRGFRADRDHVNGERFETEWYKLLANVHGTAAAELRDRDKRHQLRAVRRKLFVSVAGVLALLVVSIGALGLWQRALRAEQRAEAAEARQREISEQSQTALAEAKRESGGDAVPPPPPPPLQLPATGPQEENVPVAAPPARVYFHIRDAAQRGPAEAIEAAVEKLDGVVVPGIQQLAAGPDGSELRVFRAAERDEGERIADVIRRQGVGDLTVRLISGYEQSTTIRKRHFEVWFSPKGLRGR